MVENDGESRGAGSAFGSGRRWRRGGWFGRLYRLARAVLAFGMLLQILLIFTPLADLFGGWLNVTADPVVSDYIVCLRGQDRGLIWAAELYRRGLAPRLVVSNMPMAAEEMRDRLVRLGVPSDRILVDAGSYRTADHPERVADLPGVDRAQQRFILVADKMDSRRVAACFRRAGYGCFVVSAGESASAAAGQVSRWRWRERVFSLPHLVYEYVALVQYWWQDEI